MYNLQDGVKTAAMADQKMEDLDSQLEVSKFFQSIFWGFIKLKQYNYLWYKDFFQTLWNETGIILFAELH